MKNETAFAIVSHVCVRVTSEGEDELKRERT